MEPVYEAVRYAADGHAGEVDPADPAMSGGAVLARGTLAECRAAIAAAAVRADPELGTRRGPSIAQRRWSGLDGDVEAYHESDEEGCGGWAIRPSSQA